MTERVARERDRATRSTNVLSAGAGVIRLRWRKLIKVYERRTVGGELWCCIKAIQFETLNPDDHLWGWIAAAELRSLDVFAD